MVNYILHTYMYVYVLHIILDLIRNAYYGNVLNPFEMQNPPQIKFGYESSDMSNQDNDESSSGELFTLIISSLDSNYFSCSDCDEIIHFGISNIKQSSNHNQDQLTNQDDIWCSYLPPIPAKGSGYI